MGLGNKGCCQPPIIPNGIHHKWQANSAPVILYTANQIAAISGYVLNNASSTGPVTVHFFRGGAGGGTLPFQLTIQPGEYQSFSIVAVDTIQINPDGKFATGDFHITINFKPY